MSPFFCSVAYLVAAVGSWIEMRAKGAPRRAFWLTLLVFAAAWAATLYAILTLRPPSVLEVVEAVYRHVPVLNRLLSR